jgi:hypothetical protein
MTDFTIAQIRVASCLGIHILAAVAQHDASVAVALSSFLRLSPARPDGLLDQTLNIAADIIINSFAVRTRVTIR